MKQFGKIFKFEIKNFISNKVFVGITIFAVVLIAGIMFFPRVKEMIDTPDSLPSTGDAPVMLISDKNGNTEAMKEMFSAAFTDYEVKTVDYDIKNIKDLVISGEAECAFVLEGLTSCTYYVNNLSIYETKNAVAAELLKELYRMSAMVGSGISPEDAEMILGTEITLATEALGVDQMQNYWYTYIMIMALYMVIILYGQMISTNVATEKSSRAMELLVTSTSPLSMMFGKVLSSCLAGFTQLLVIFGSAFVCFNLNREYWDDGGIISSMFDIPLDMLVYMLIFFIFGFLVYAFLFGAIGSTVSKLEELNTAVMPVTMIYIVAFMIVLMSITSNSVDSSLMKICSFIPFTSPMAMFARIAMSTVSPGEIAASISILVLSAAIIGYMAAKIYRMGVLLYGNAPKPAQIIKMVFAKQ